MNFIKHTVLLLSLSASHLVAMEGGDNVLPAEPTAPPAHVAPAPAQEVTWYDIPDEVKLNIIDYTLSAPASRTSHLKMYANLCATDKTMRRLAGDKIFIKNDRFVKETLLGNDEKEAIAKTYFEFHEKFLDVLRNSFKAFSGVEELKTTAEAFKNFLTDYYFVNPKNFHRKNNESIQQFYDSDWINNIY